MTRLAQHPRNNRTIYICLVLALVFSSGIQTTFALDTQPVRHLFDLAVADNSSLNLPSDVAVAPDSRIYIVDGGNHRVVIYKSSGDFIGILGSKGVGVGQFYMPLGITVDKKGRVYVADTGNHRVQIFDQTDMFVKQIPIREKDVKIRPVDVATSPSMDTLYVTGNNNHKIMLYNRQGHKVGQWGKKVIIPPSFVIQLL